jgi:phosphopantetheinyl transferase (holo-ACP synthase)
VLKFSDALAKLLKGRGVTETHLSLSDEKGIAFATVILECEK